jgi:hypothetical protein
VQRFGWAHHEALESSPRTVGSSVDGLEELFILSDGSFDIASIFSNVSDVALNGVYENPMDMSIVATSSDGS